MSATTSALDVMRALAVQLAAFQSLLLAIAALHKLVGRSRANKAIHELTGVPLALAPLAVPVIALLELSASAMLCFPSHRTMGGSLAALLWGAYLVSIARAIGQGRRDVDCGCSFGATQRPLGLVQVVRNAVLTSLALLVVVVSVTSGVSPVTAEQGLAAVALLALYGAVDQVIRLRPLRSGEIQ